MIPFRLGAASLVATFLLTAAGPVFGQAESSALLGPLPEGIEAYADVRGQCFLPGEREGLERALDSERIALEGCARGVVPPMTLVQASRTYKQGSNRIIDCVSLRRDLWQTGRLDRFLADLVAETDGPSGSALCAARMIETWARAGAMSEVAADGSESQSRAAIMWTLGGVSAAYFANPAVQVAAREGGADTAIIGWFRGLAEGVKVDIRRKQAAEDEDNIQYWQGFAILPTALLAGDPELLELSRGTFTAAMREVTEKSADPQRDGFLPLELERGNKSLHYQAYATYPIVGMAVASQAYGCDFVNSRWKRRQFVNLMTRTMAGVIDPNLFTDEIARRLPGITRSEQQKSYTVRHSPELLPPIERLSPGLYDRIDAGVAAIFDRPRPVFPPETTENGSVTRLGGQFAKFADAAEALGEERAEGLAEICGEGR